MTLPACGLPMPPLPPGVGPRPPNLLIIFCLQLVFAELVRASPAEP